MNGGASRQASARSEAPPNNVAILDAWRTFAAPGSQAEFCQAWLTLLCEQLPGVSAGVLLLRGDEDNTFLPVAVWPASRRDLSFLGTVAERALTDKRGVVNRAEPPGEGVHIAYPIEVSHAMRGAVVLEASGRAEPEVGALLRQMHWGVGWLHDWFHRQESSEQAQRSTRIGTAMEVLATALRDTRLQQMLFDVANQICQQLRCSRVAIGLALHDTLRVQALSNAAWFEKNASIMKLYAAAMEEAYDRMAMVTHEQPAEGDGSGLALTAHARLAGQSGAMVLLSVPLRLGARCVGVITLERDSREPFDASQVEWVDTVAHLLPSVIDHKRRAQRGVLALVGDDGRALMRRLFGPRHLVWKFGALLMLLAVVLMVLVRIDYRVSAKTTIEGEVQRSTVAPFDGFLASAQARAGDVVRQGQVLAVLDDRDLRLEQHKWDSERAQRLGQLREALAKHNLSDIQILKAQVQQSEAQLALVTERIARAQLTAPFDGIVISGDLSQLIGSPLEVGKKLFEVAPLHAYRVVLQVDEKEVRHVQVGQQGQIMVSGIASDPLAFTVSKVTPVAAAQEGRNFFRVEAQLREAPPNLRPGMEGVGKVNVGERRLWWVLTHSFSDWLRVALWNWLP
jgi:multidrug resistance efflux pump